MLILILIGAQYLRKADFSFEKRLDRQNYSSWGSLHPVKKFPPSKISSEVGEPNLSPNPYRYLDNPAISDNGKLSGDAFADPIIPF